MRRCAGHGDSCRHKPVMTTKAALTTTAMALPASASSRHRSAVLRREGARLTATAALAPAARLVPRPAKPKTPPSVLEVCAKMLVLPIQSEDFYNNAIELRKILCQNQPPIQSVMETGLIPRLIEAIDKTISPRIRLEVLWIITNMAGGTSEHTQAIIDAGAVPLLINILTERKSVDELLTQAVWALGNIAGDNTKCRDLVLSLGVMQPLLRLLPGESDAKLELDRQCMWLLSSLFRGKTPRPEDTLIEQALPHLSRKILQSADVEVVADACWALAYASDGCFTSIQRVLELDCVPRLVELLAHPNKLLVTPALRTLGNIATGNEAQTQVILDHGLLGKLHDLLRRPEEAIQKEAAWVLSNVAAGSQHQIQMLMDHDDLVQDIIKTCHKSSLKTQKECIWTLGNLINSHLKETVQRIAQTEGCIAAFCNSLHLLEANELELVLDAIINILRCDADAVKVVEKHLDAIEIMQAHENAAVYRKAFEIVDTYFSGQPGARAAETDQDLPPKGAVRRQLDS